MQTTGKVSHKQYKCPRCQNKEPHSTNHYGKIYVRCKNCSWKNPMDPIVAMECQDPLPEGWDTPPKWKKTTLKGTK